MWCDFGLLVGGAIQMSLSYCYCYPHSHWEMWTDRKISTLRNAMSCLWLNLTKCPYCHSPSDVRVPRPSCCRLAGAAEATETETADRISALASCRPEAHRPFDLLRRPRLRRRSSADLRTDSETERIVVASGSVPAQRPIVDRHHCRGVSRLGRIFPVCRRHIIMAIPECVAAWKVVAANNYRRVEYLLLGIFARRYGRICQTTRANVNG